MTIPDNLLEADGVFQNRTITVGIIVKRLPDGATRLEITDGHQGCAILLDPLEKEYLVGLLG